ncbi:MAG: hypothetical protein ACRDPW_02470, partial [Mycobacteriales bacterium]
CTSSSGVTATDSASDWTGAFCDAGSTVRSDLSFTNDVLGSQLRSGLPPAEIKSSLSNYIDRAADSATVSVSRLDEAGSPSVDGGDQIAEAAKVKYTNVSKQLEDLQAKVQAMPTSSLNQFTAALKPISEQIAQISRDIAGSFKELERFPGYSEILAASKKVDENGTLGAPIGSCKKLQEVRQ